MKPFDKNTRSDSFPNPLKKLSQMPGEVQNHHHKVVDSMLHAWNIPKKLEIGEHERLMREAQQRIKVIRDYASIIADEHTKMGKSLDKAKFLGELHEKYGQSFGHYNKDELLLFLVAILSQSTLGEVA